MIPRAAEARHRQRIGAFMARDAGSVDQPWMRRGKPKAFCRKSPGFSMPQQGVEE